MNCIELTTRDSYISVFFPLASPCDRLRYIWPSAFGSSHLRRNLGYCMLVNWCWTIVVFPILFILISLLQAVQWAKKLSPVIFFAFFYMFKLFCHRIQISVRYLDFGAIKAVAAWQLHLVIVGLGLLIHQLKLFCCFLFFEGFRFININWLHIPLSHKNSIIRERQMPYHFHWGSDENRHWILKLLDLRLPLVLPILLDFMRIYFGLNTGSSQPFERIKFVAAGKLAP
jgi:hypothetical protein